MVHKITGYIEKDPGTGLYVAIVPGIPGAHTQAKTLDDLQKNLKEVVELCLEEMDARPLIRDILREIELTLEDYNKLQENQ